MITYCLCGGSFYWWTLPYRQFNSLGRKMCLQL